MARYDDLNTNMIGLTTFVSAIVLFILILMGRALCYTLVGMEDERKLQHAHYEKSDQEIARQKALLTQYQKVTEEVPGEVVNGKEGAPVKIEKLHIPVERARDLLLQEWKSEPQA